MIGIKPDPSDIGRSVIYIPGYAREQFLEIGQHPGVEFGTLTHFNENRAFVRYWGQFNSKATSFNDLVWAGAI
jgi:hypothetical protein